MKGKIIIKVSEHGCGINCDLVGVSILDKFVLMHALAVALRMDDTDMHLYTSLEKSGVLKDTDACTACANEEQLDSMLKGEQPEGITIDMTELRRQLNES